MPERAGDQTSGPANAGGTTTEGSGLLGTSGGDAPARRTSEIAVAKPLATSPPASHGRAPSAPVAGEASSPAGFSARIQNTSLFDLIQFECQDRTRKIVRITDGPRAAFLYFRDGNIVHAIEGREVGEHAVRSLLRWPQGSLDHVEGPWPAHETITIPWQGLLLRATQEQDEARRSPKVLSFPTRDASAAGQPGRSGAAERASEVERGGDDVTKRTPFPGAAHDPATATLRLSARGELMAGNGGEELAEVVAYTVQMADLVGELLGIEGFVSMEFSLANGTVLIAREDNGEVVAVRARVGIDTATLRSTLGI